MFYLAILCIVLGLLCLLYLAFILAGKGENTDSGPSAAADTPAPPFREFKPEPSPETVQSPIRNPNPNTGTGAPASDILPPPLPEPQGSRPPIQPRTPAGVAAAGGPGRPGDKSPNSGKNRERTSEFRRIDTDALADTLRVYSRREAPTREAEAPLIVGGILYLNNSRYLPAVAGESPTTDADFAPRAFANLRRVGQGTLVLEGGGFHIHCGNANYSYTVSDLEQIVFQERGVALIPTRHDHAVPVFITERPEQIKNYIKNHAHIIHGRP